MNQERSDFKVRIEVVSSLGWKDRDEEKSGGC